VSAGGSTVFMSCELRDRLRLPRTGITSFALLLPPPARRLPKTDRLGVDPGVSEPR